MAKSSFGPCSSVDLEEMYSSNMLDGQSEIRFIDLYSIKNKKPFSFFKLKDLEDPKILDLIDLSELVKKAIILNNNINSNNNKNNINNQYFYDNNDEDLFDDYLQKYNYNQSNINDSNKNNKSNKDKEKNKRKNSSFANLQNAVDTKDNMNNTSNYKINCNGLIPVDNTKSKTEKKNTNSLDNLLERILRNDINKREEGK